MLFKKLWRTMGLYKAQFLSMIIMTALGIGVFIGFQMEWYSIEKNMDAFFEDTGFADYRIISENGFTAEDEAKISAIDGVSGTSRFLSVNADVKEYGGDSVALTVTENEAVSGFVVMEGEAYEKESKDGIWLSQRYAEKNGIRVGDRLTLVYKNLEIGGRVAGLVKSGEYMICVRDETQLMPDSETYGFAYISPVMYEAAAGSAYYPQLNVLSELDKKEFIDAVDEALGTTLLVLSKEENVSYAGASGEVEEGKTMGSVMPLLFLMIAVLTMVTTMHRLTAKEKTQIGTLKALGFKDRRILRHYTSYALMIGVLGSAFGIAIGYALGWFIMNPKGAMGTYLDMPRWHLFLPWFCYVILAVLLALLTLIGYLSTRKMLRGTAAEALRPYAPKKMKPLLVERTKLFHRLSFGTRWNMRDIMRHKSRTAMSLLGIIGCMMIIVCSLGMKDTVDAFLDLYYNEATKYASRIYLSEEADREQREELIQKYQGDWSSSVSVQLNDKAVSLDIYSLENDMVRFPGEDSGTVELGTDGAYLCIRLADELELSAGDTVSVSPYGSDREYTLKVAGVVRSVTESIVISSEYAETLQIPYTVDSIYTDTEKSAIAADGAIKSVQSKQMLMDSFDTFMELMNLMIVILVLAAMLLGVVVLYNLGVMSYTERYREMATLKVVGFKDGKIGRLLIGQNLWVTVLGMAVGLPLGIVVLNYLLKELASEYEMKLVLGPVTYLVSLLLTLGVSMLVSMMVARKNRNIDMVEALKGAE